MTRAAVSSGKAPSLQVPGVQQSVQLPARTPGSFPCETDLRLVVTRHEGRILTALISGNVPLELSLEDEDAVLGNIYVGKVKTVVKNLNAAFVDFSEGRSGYYSLTDNPRTLFTDSRTDGKLKSGDEILVQVAKEAVKTKDPVLTANLTFTGKYAVLTASSLTVGFSAKIQDKEFKERLRPRLLEALDGRAGVIVRTNAYGAEEELFSELSRLLAQYEHVREIAPYRTRYSLLYRAQPGYIASLRSRPAGSLSRIVTDIPEVYETVRQYLMACQPKETGILRFYEDRLLPLSRLYSLETALKAACQKRVWLKSGGYLVIEPTEAMVVVDVNTGKYAGKKEPDAAVRKINLEAAQEICRQLRLRNLSGIILVDFIDMKEESDREQLLSELRRLVLSDSVKTTVVDMTPLGLVEMTRKKTRRPLHEQLRGADVQAGPDCETRPSAF